TVVNTPRPAAPATAAPTPAQPPPATPADLPIVASPSPSVDQPSSSVASETAAPLPPTTAPALTTAAPVPAPSMVAAAPPAAAVAPAPALPANVPDAAPIPSTATPVPAPVAMSTATPLPPTMAPSSTPTPVPPATPTPAMLACPPGSVGLFVADGGFQALWTAEPRVRAAMGCPIDREIGPARGTIQRFQNGILIFWHRDQDGASPPENTIYAVFDRTGTWQRFNADALPNGSPTYACPPGGVVPELGFGKLLVAYPSLRDNDRLGGGGCALGREEPYEAATRQQFVGGSMVFVKLLPAVPQNPFWVFSGSESGPFTQYVR